LSKQLKITQDYSGNKTLGKSFREQAKCAYCGHKRSVIQFSKSDGPTQEQVWCPKCTNTFTHYRDSDDAQDESVAPI